MVLLALVLLAGVPLGGAYRPVPSTTTWLAAGVFGAFELMCLLALVRPDRLEISPSGLYVRHLWFAHRFGWDQLSGFRLVQRARTDGSNRTVGITLVGDHVGRLSPRLMAPSWELPTGEVLALLEQGRARWRTSPETDVNQALASSAPQFVSDRMGRRTYWIAIAALLVFGAVVSLLPDSKGETGGVVGASVLLFRGRLHDVGRSAWWSVGLLPAPLVLLNGIDNLAYLQFSIVHGPTLTAAALLSGVALAIGAFIWLGAKPGDPAENGYGVAPAARPRLIF